MGKISLNESSKEFTALIEKISSQKVNVCYQCLKCTAGCPMAEEMDYPPAQIVHAIRLGIEDIVINSNTIWVCVSCETCTTRCPQGLDIAHLMDAARNIAFRRNIKPPEDSGMIEDFYKVALSNIRSYGRMYELGMIMSYKMKTKEYLKDMKLGMKMGMKGKLKILPDKTKGAKDIDRIFSRVEKLEKLENKEEKV